MEKEEACGATLIFQGVHSEGSGASVRGYKHSAGLDTGHKLSFGLKIMTFSFLFIRFI